MKPIHPIVRLNLAQILVTEYNMTAQKAVPFATRMIEVIRLAGMDIVMGSWMDGEVHKGGFRWEDIPALAAELEETHPWNSVELR